LLEALLTTNALLWSLRLQKRREAKGTMAAFVLDELKIESPYLKAQELTNQLQRPIIERRSG